MIKKMPILVKLFKMKEFLKIKIEEQLNLYKEKKKAFLKDLKIKWEKPIGNTAKDLFEKFKFYSSNCFLKNYFLILFSYVLFFNFFIFCN